MRNVQDKQCRQEVLDRLVALAKGVGDGSCPSHKTCKIGNQEASEKISDVMQRMSRVVGEDITEKSRRWPLPAARGLSYMYIHLDGLPYNRQARLLGIGLATMYHSIRLIGQLIEAHDSELLDIIYNYELLTLHQNNMNKTFQDIADELVELHERKDADYGDSFGDSYKLFGLAAPVIRLNDKMNRIKNICDRPGQVSDETLRDTLVDLACYAIMTIVELDNEPKL